MGEFRNNNCWNNSINHTTFMEIIKDIWNVHVRLATSDKQTSARCGTMRHIVKHFFLITNKMVF